MYSYDIDSQQFCTGPAPEGCADPVAYVGMLIEAHAAYLRSKYCASVSPYEAASWPLKLAEAQQGGGPMLTAEAIARGITLSDLCAKVLSKGVLFAGLEAMLSGVSGKHRDALAQLAQEDVFAYDWRDGWPG